MRIAIPHQLSSVLRKAVLAITLAAGSSMASAGVIHVAVDTSNFGVTSGYIDMQLSTGNDPLTTALVSNLFGFAPGALVDAIGVTPVAGGYLFRNDTFSDLLIAANFGGLLSFDLTFGSVIDPLGLHQSQFVLAAYDAAFSLLGNGDPQSGMLASFTWTPSATAGIDGNISANIADPAVTFVPEPSGTLLAGIGLAAIALVSRRRRRPVGRAADAVGIAA